MIVVIDEGVDLPLEIAWQEVVFEQDAVLKRLVLALDLALCLGMAGRTARVIHAVVDSHAARSDETYDGGAVVAEQSRPLHDRCAVAA